MPNAPRNPSESEAQQSAAATVVRLPSELAQLVDRLARESGRTPVAVLAWALAAALARGELPPRAALERLRCADPTCRKWFTRPTEGVGSTKLYHSPECSRRTREREAKRRARAK